MNSYKHWGTGKDLSPVLGDRSEPGPNVGDRSGKTSHLCSKEFTMEDCINIRTKEGMYGKICP